MAFIKLTNNYGIQKGNPIIINTDQVASVYEEHTPDGVKTLVYGGPTGVIWDVEESFKEVQMLLENASGKCSCN